VNDEIFVLLQTYILNYIFVSTFLQSYYFTGRVFCST